MKPDPSGTYTVLPGAGGTSGHTSTCTAAACTRSGTLPTPHGNPRGTMVPSATFPKGAIGAGALALGSRLLPWLSTGYALYDWFKDAGIAIDPATGGFTEIQGGTTSVSSYWSVSESGSSRFGSADAFCSAEQTKAVNYWKSQEGLVITEVKSLGYLVTSLSAYQSRCTTRVSFKERGSLQNLNSNIDVYKYSGSNLCVDSAGVVSAVGIGGKCPTGTPAPVSTASAKTKLENTPVTGDVLSRSLDEVLRGGGSVEDSGVHGVTGPASVPGGTTTRQTQKPDGTTSVSVTNVTYNYTYNNNTVTASMVEKTTNPDGSTEQTTSQPERTECEKNPGAASCQELGQAQDQALKTDTKDIKLTPVAFSENGACPAPVTFTVYGTSRSFSFEPVCEQASGVIRAVVLLAAGFVAAWIFVDGLKS